MDSFGFRSHFLFTFILAFFVFSGCSFLPQQPTAEQTSQLEQEIKEKTQAATEFLEKEVEQNEETQDYKISHIVDGDTIYVIVNGKEEKIRIMGIDTPEKEGGFRTAECFGDDASEYAQEYLKGKRVALLKVKPQG